ncbi:MAG TPA: hypothetical protein VK524_32485, partial [Polyangiaceae bacterium]|nr:hypothetical protein [Polyangiaceae bacterium]
EWGGEQNERYVPVLLSHPDDLGWALTGLAVLVLPPGVRFSYPSRFAAELSKTLASSGDAQVVHS